MENDMIVYGKHVCTHILHSCAECIQEVLLAKEIDKRLFSRFAMLGVPIVRIDSKKAQALCKGGNHQGYLLKINPPKSMDLQHFKAMNRLLLLEGVTDTHNIGAVCRSAYALGFEGIVLTHIQSFSLPGAIRTSSAALLHLPFALCKNALDVCHELKMAGFSLYGAISGGDDWKIDCLPSKIVLCLGSEDEGLSKRFLAKMDFLISIGLCNNFDSLNISTAAAILMDRIQNGR